MRAVLLLQELSWLRPEVLPFRAFSVHGQLRSEGLPRLLIDGSVAVPPLRSQSLWFYSTMKGRDFDAGDFGLVAYTTQRIDEEGFEELFYTARRVGGTRYKHKGVASPCSSLENIHESVPSRSPCGPLGLCPDAVGRCGFCFDCKNATSDAGVRVELVGIVRFELESTGRDCTQLWRSVYYGLLSATSQMLGLQSILLDWGWKFNAHVWMDATAGLAIGSRRGLGRVKHIDTVSLWVQATVTEGKISPGKPTKEMLAYFLTKHVDAATMQSCMAGLGMRFQSGESKLTLNTFS